MTDGTFSSKIITWMNGNYSLSKRCSPAAPALWAFAVIAVLHLNALIHASFVKPVNPKPAVRVASKAPNSGLPSSAIFCRIANGNILPSLCLTYFGLFLTITGTCSTNSFAVQPAPCSKTPSAKASKLAFFVRCILTVANSINIRIFIYPSRVGDSLNMTPGNRFSLKRKTLKRSGAVRSFDSLGITIFSYNPINCLASGTFAIIRPGAVTSMPSFNVIGKYILPKRHAGPGIM
ncbi:hypothetical protein ArsFIN_54120 (plasmid) [Arsenophonus nasoniae]|uniref:Uncharacterized protein n=1 Tax=Arsenophonus nasoniae TaxID=638 RepID=A0A4P7L2K3_9GAMM|nr:hypothetical protein ArsFIN_54120 [Arsenophonus nasoniae]